jgi:hypothetical protein
MGGRAMKTKLLAVAALFFSLCLNGHALATTFVENIIGHETQNLKIVNGDTVDFYDPVVPDFIDIYDLTTRSFQVFDQLFSTQYDYTFTLEGEYQVLVHSNSGVVFDVVVAASATPLPAALPLFATGLGALGLLGWRRKRKLFGR